ncbi:MAG: hypothetical protein LUQ65_00365 [Candidatus Helarchaeota archaeon]|nr:hypothetical protein [Candidatus Helarchaeota archaeon]
MVQEQEWTSKEKFIARFISWGIIISVSIVILGGLWTALELVIYFSNPGTGLEIIDWFIALDWVYKLLIIGGLIVGAILGMIGFSIFLKRGQKFLLNLLFKIKQ